LWEKVAAQGRVGAVWVWHFDIFLVCCVYTTPAFWRGAGACQYGYKIPHYLFWLFWEKSAKSRFYLRANQTFRS